MTTSTVRVWIEVEAVRSTWDWSKGKLVGAQLGRTFKRRPKTPRADTHLVLVDLVVPHTVFEHAVTVEL